MLNFFKISVKLSTLLLSTLLAIAVPAFNLVAIPEPSQKKAPQALVKSAPVVSKKIEAAPKSPIVTPKTQNADVAPIKPIQNEAPASKAPAPKVLTTTPKKTTLIGDSGTCSESTGSCNSDTDCCSDQLTLICGSSKTCCAALSNNCNLNTDCCTGTPSTSAPLCLNNNCCTPNVGDTCTNDSDCCLQNNTWLSCINNKCAACLDLNSGENSYSCSGDSENGHTCSGSTCCCTGLICNSFTLCNPCGNQFNELGCGATSDCCAGLICNSEATCTSCGTATNNVSCGLNTDCCAGLICNLKTNLCESCKNSGGACGTKADCCPNQNLLCLGSGICSTCLTSGTCKLNRDCCAGLTCNSISKTCVTPSEQSATCGVDSDCNQTDVILTCDTSTTPGTCQTPDICTILSMEWSGEAQDPNSQSETFISQFGYTNTIIQNLANQAFFTACSVPVKPGTTCTASEITPCSIAFYAYVYGLQIFDDLSMALSSIYANLCNSTTAPALAAVATQMGNALRAIEASCVSSTDPNYAQCGVITDQMVIYLNNKLKAAGLPLLPDAPAGPLCATEQTSNCPLNPVTSDEIINDLTLNPTSWPQITYNDINYNILDFIANVKDVNHKTFAQNNIPIPYPNNFACTNGDNCLCPNKTSKCSTANIDYAICDNKLPCLCKDGKSTCNYLDFSKTDCKCQDGSACACPDDAPYKYTTQIISTCGCNCPGDENHFLPYECLCSNKDHTQTSCTYNEQGVCICPKNDNLACLCAGKLCLEPINGTCGTGNGNCTLRCGASEMNNQNQCCISFETANNSCLTSPVPCCINYINTQIGLAASYIAAALNGLLNNENIWGYASGYYIDNCPIPYWIQLAEGYTSTCINTTNNNQIPGACSYVQP